MPETLTIDRGTRIKIDNVQPLDESTYMREDGTPIVHRPGVNYEGAEPDNAFPAEEDAGDVYADSLVDPSDTTESLSPTADLIDTAADRLSNYLRDRAETRRQARADQDAAYGTYAENIAATATRERAERIDAAKDKIRGFGRSALGRVKNAAAKTLDGMLLTGFAAADGARAAKAGLERMDQFVDEKTAEVQAAARAKAGELTTAGMNKAEAVAGRAGAAMEAGVESATSWASTKVENARETVVDAKETATDVIEAYRGRYLRMREKAITRKLERRRKWANRREAFVVGTRSAYERNKARADVVRGVGSVVVSHLGEVYGQLKDTKNVAAAARADLAGSRQL